MGLLDFNMSGGLGPLSDPRFMGLLGLAQGLGQASAPSRLPVPMGVASSMGMQGLMGGVGQGIQTAMAMQKMQWLQELAAQQQGGGVDPNSVGPALNAGANTPSQGAAGAMLSGGAAPAGPGPTKFAEGLLQPAQAAPGMALDPRLAPVIHRMQLSERLGIPDKSDELLLQNALTAQLPTNEQKNANDPRFGDAYIRKQSYIAPTSLRPGGYMFDPTTGNISQLPNIPAGFTATGGPGNWGASPVPITSGQAAPQSSAPAPLRNNNPGALMPGGQLASYPDLQAGLSALDSNLQNYGKQGVNTLSGIINKWAPSTENDTNAYIADVSKRLGVGANQPIDLSNPAQRQALSTAIMLHENGPSAVFGAQRQAPTGETLPGALAKADANAKANVGIGENMYEGAQKEATNLNVYRQSLNEMWNLANNPNNKFGPGAPTIARLKALASNAGLDMSQAQTSQDVMMKLANFIGMSQLGSGGQTGTDAQLQTILHSVPNGEMTNEAMKAVIPLLVSQLDVKQGRANVAANFKKQNGSDLTAIPDALTKYNSVADPGSVSLGLQLAGLKGQGLQDFVAGLKKQYGNSFQGIMGRIRQLDQLGAFSQ